MDSFLEKFLTEVPPHSVGEQPQRVFFAVFGKHPGWDDHIEDIGLETASLVTAKHLLYNRGIRGQLEAGAWEQMEPGKRLMELHHWFIWARRGQLLVGRLWPSKDGKGRALYPMVACFHLFGLSFSEAMRRLLPRLEVFEKACREVTRQEAVRELVKCELGSVRESLRSAAQPFWDPAETTAETKRILGAMGLGPSSPELWRVIYAIENGMSEYRAHQLRRRGEAMRSHQFRVPCAREWVGETANFWQRLLLERLDPGTQLLFTVPIGERWLDITLGEPTVDDFFSLRATPQALPLASEIPYSLTPEFITATKAALELFIQTPVEPMTEITRAGTGEGGGESVLRRLFGFWSRR